LIDNNPGTPYTGGGNIIIYDEDNNPIGNVSIDLSDGTYSFSDPATEGTARTIVIDNLTGNYSPDQINLNGGGWTSSGLSGSAFSFTFDTPPTPYDLDWLLSNTAPWIDPGGGGDVRDPNIDNNNPGGSGSGTPECSDNIDNNSNGLIDEADPACHTDGDPDDDNDGIIDTIDPDSFNSYDPNDPAEGTFTIFFSSEYPANFGAGGPGSGSVVNSEYGYNSDPRTHTGFFSYTFFYNRARVLNVPLVNIQSVCPVLTNCNLTGLEDRTIYWADGDLTISSYDHPSSAHVLILVKGKLTINGNIDGVLPAIGNLLVIAVKGDVTIGGGVGGAPTSSTPHIQAVLTSERSVILDGGGCSDGTTADPKLNFQGSIITNSLKPFATGGAGKFVNRRSLCANDATYPVLTINPRYDFVPQLTDFYKVPSIRWKEIAP
jgi:hypothetical protein